jgi:hypothetical protein
MEQNLGKTLSSGFVMDELKVPSIYYDCTSMCNRDIIQFKFKAVKDGKKYGFIGRATEEIIDMSEEDMFELFLKDFMTEVVVPLVLGKAPGGYLVQEGCEYPCYALKDDKIGDLTNEQNS